MAKCNQLTSLPFKGLINNDKLILWLLVLDRLLIQHHIHWRNPSVTVTTSSPLISSSPLNPLKGRGVNWLHFAIQVWPTFLISDKLTQHFHGTELNYWCENSNGFLPDVTTLHLVIGYRKSVCLSSVTFVRPSHEVEISPIFHHHFVL